MKRILILWLCILCCMFPLSACSQPGKSVEDLVEMGLAQLGKPLGEAYQALGLPGNPEDAVVFPFLLAEDSVELHGKRLGIVLDHAGEEEGELMERSTSIVEYFIHLDGDYAYALALYQELSDLYGEMEPMGSRLPFNEATEDSLKSMVLDEECAGLWRTEDNEIVLLYSVDEKACTLALDIKIPLERLGLSPIYTPDGTRIR